MDPQCVLLALCPVQLYLSQLVRRRDPGQKKDLEHPRGFGIKMKKGSVTIEEKKGMIIGKNKNSRLFLLD